MSPTPEPRRILLLALACSALGALAPATLAQPVNNNCANATPALAGATTTGTAALSTNDGSCSGSAVLVGDVYHSFTTGVAGTYSFSMCAATNWDTLISVHTGCPATVDNEVDWDDDGCVPFVFGVPSLLRTYLAPATPYIIRITGYDATAQLGPYGLAIAAPAAKTGACCFGNQCSLLTASGCALISGSYKGDFTACAQPVGAPTTYIASGVPAQIPDNTPAGVTTTINVPASFTVADVRLNLNISHPWMGDVTIRLTHGATTVTIIQRAGLNTGGFNSAFGFDLDLAGNYVFADTAAQTAWDAAAVQPSSATILPPSTYLASDGNAQAVSLRQIFAGQNASGLWSLTITDTSPPDGGVLNSWSLALDASAGDPCASGQGACCTGTPQGGLGTTCIQSTLAGCPGSFRGTGVACTNGPDNPVACCKANINGTGGVTIDDLFIYINVWLAGCVGQAGSPCNGINADFNGAGGLTIDDLFIYINSWLAGCG